MVDDRTALQLPAALHPPATGAAAAPLAAAMDELAHGIVVLTQQGRVLHANQAARHELGSRRLLAVHEGQLRALGESDERQLHAALLRTVGGKRSLVTLSHLGATLTAAVLPLKPAEEGEAPRAMLMFGRSAVCDSLMLCFFARSHGLTATEEQVLGILCQGFSAPEVAQQLQVAVSTVRSHVRSLCAKTRSSGVRELVNRVAILPPVATALLHQPMH